ISNIRQMSRTFLDSISHFFEHYKDLEDGKWVRVDDWLDVDDAKKEIMESVERFDNAKEKPNF
ncbi:MAG: inorganic pyrophosphatase, partial [Gammaproteobacteria bacterium]|nr:inorganic pyrophosphatase [Gammaproteobacteria bacterium]